MSLFDVAESSESEAENEGARFPEYVTDDIDTIFSTPTKEWFVKYEPLDNSQDYRLHPGANVVESYPLNFVKPPMPNNDDVVIRDNVELTTVQLDALRLASSRFQQTFSESGITKGFLLGDGPGLGKTRILAAIIYNEFLKGHKRHLFLSISDILFEDVVNEFEKIASLDWVELHVKDLDKFESTMRLQDFEGVVFMTYHRLRKAGSSGPTPSNISRLSGVDVIKNFCGREIPFRGVIALDESHVGKNALNPIFDLRSTTGQVILDVIWEYKNAKVVYSTATPASNSNHLGIMSRLGIWGPEKYFSEFAKFDKLMSKWELAAAELMALKLKQEGAMVCRQISFEGVETTAEYIPSESEPENFRENYDRFSDMWRRMYEDVVIIASFCDPDLKKTKIATFFSALMNFFRALIIDSKTNRLVEMIRQEIDKGHVVVVGIQGTGESSYSDHNRDELRTDLISNAKEIMEKLVKNHFCVPMQIMTNKRNDSEIANGNDSSTIVSDGNVAHTSGLNQSQNERSVIHEDLELSSSDEETNDHDHTILTETEETESTKSNNGLNVKVDDETKIECKDIPEVNEIRKKWFKELEDVKNAPPNFLDEIQKRLSEYDNITVAEITGRRLQVEAKEGGYKLVDRSVDCDQERKDFMEGKANVAIISDAGSTGISLHASNAKEEFCKKLRIHITVELGWSAEKVLQQLGRTHRANQRQPPVYRFLLSNVPAEIRFTSIILGRLSTMSTFTCAQRNYELCSRLEEQAKYDSNPGIRGIRAALAFFFDEDVPIPYEKDVELKYEVLHQMEQLGLKSRKEKTSIAKSQGRTLKRVNLTKIMNKLLGCTLKVQEIFCDVWLFYLTYFREQYNKDHGVIVIPPHKCQIVEDETIESLIKHEKEEGVVLRDETDAEQNDNSGLNNIEVNNPSDAQDSTQSHCPEEACSSNENPNNTARPCSHGPVYLVGLHAFLGSTAGTVRKLYESLPESDKVSGFYHDGGIAGVQNLRYFYLANKCFTDDEQQLLIMQKIVPNDRLETNVCVLYQPHQPPMELTGHKVLDFLATMTKVLSSIAIGQWLKQASSFKDTCIHKYSLGDCEFPSCVVGKRHSLKYIVVGDLPAIWPDIIDTLKDEDPSVIVCKDFLTGKIRIGVEIPKYSITSLKMKINGHDFYSLGSNKTSNNTIAQ